MHAPACAPGSNLLINDEGQLKLADFGLARPFDENNKAYTNRVITLWYRPPELLLGEQKYGSSIDMWSAGCLFAELLMRKPILTGRNELQQIQAIFQMFGTPTEETWPGVSSLQHYDFARQDPAAGGAQGQAREPIRRLWNLSGQRRGQCLGHTCKPCRDGESLVADARHVVLWHHHTDRRRALYVDVSHDAALLQETARQVFGPGQDEASVRVGPDDPLAEPGPGPGQLRAHRAEHLLGHPGTDPIAGLLAFEPGPGFALPRRQHTHLG